MLLLCLFLARLCEVIVAVVAGGTRQNLSVVGFLFPALSGSGHHGVWLFNLLDCWVSLALDHILGERDVEETLDRLDQLVIKAHLKFAAEEGCPVSDPQPLKLAVVSASPIQDAFCGELAIFKLSRILQTSVGGL